jgi:hypothetical protein
VSGSSRPGVRPEPSSPATARDLGYRRSISDAAVEAVIGFSTRPEGARVGRIDESLAARLGVVGVTVLAVRPDRYVGLRDDSGDAAVVGAYLDGLVA